MFLFELLLSSFSSNMISKLSNCFIQEHFFNELKLLPSDNIILEWYKNYFLILPLAIEANIPAKHRIVNKINAIPIPLIKAL